MVECETEPVLPVRQDLYEVSQKTRLVEKTKKTKDIELEHINSSINDKNKELEDFRRDLAAKNADPSIAEVDKQRKTLVEKTTGLSKKHAGEMEKIAELEKKLEVCTFFFPKDVERRPCEQLI